jgi:hypothetical protein
MFFQIKLRLFLNQLQVVRLYYKTPLFALTDFSLSLLYLFSNPYRICRKFLQQKGFQQIYAYGETPLTTLEHIVQTFHITPQDRWLELGSGRGKTCFWLSLHFGCFVQGIDWIPQFINKASLLTRTLSLPRLRFLQQSFHQADFSWPTVVFLYSTCMSDEEISSLLIPMQSLPRQAKVITISEPLNHPSYRLIHATPVSFPWGETEAYLHEYLKDGLRPKLR